jgi:hypothetical protein
MELRTQHVGRSFSGFRITVEAISGPNRAVIVSKVLNFIAQI